MHRFAHAVDFSPLIGAEVIQVAFGQNEVILNLHPSGWLRLEGAWTLKDKAGSVVDRATRFEGRDVWQIPKLLGQKITSCAVRDDRHLDIGFDGGAIEIEDDSDHYETFAAECGALKLYV